MSYIMATRVPKVITNKNDIDYLLNLKEEDITLSEMMELFGEFDGKIKFHPYDTFVVPKGKYGKNKKNTNSVNTTVGIWIFNRFMIENELSDTLGYLNYEINGDKWDELVDIVTEKVLEDDLELDVLDHLLQKSQKLMGVIQPEINKITNKYKGKKDNASMYKQQDEIQAYVYCINPFCYTKIS